MEHRTTDNLMSTDNDMDYRHTDTSHEPRSPTPSPYLVEGHVLVGPELVVPDLCLLPQPSQPLLQGRLLGGDVVRDWPDV